GFSGIDLGQGAGAKIIRGLQPLGRVVVEPVGVLGSEEQRDRGRQDTQFADVGIGDGVDGGRGSAGSRISEGSQEETLSETEDPLRGLARCVEVCCLLRFTIVLGSQANTETGQLSRTRCVLKKVAITSSQAEARFANV